MTDYVAGCYVISGPCSGPAPSSAINSLIYFLLFLFCDKTLQFENDVIFGVYVTNS